jgi:nuclear protein localization protein 4 homolog
LLAQLPNKRAVDLKIATQPSQDGEPVGRLVGKTIRQLGLAHGDLLFATYKLDDSAGETNGISSAESTGGPATSSPLPVKQHHLDDYLDKHNGKITRPRDPKMCRHGDKGMCDYCMPLEPFDIGYREEHKIKHMSFHAYLRKLNSEANKTNSASSYIAPLNQPYYGIQKVCPSGHPPWPEGICSKCQPSAITLQQQEFRMVDHVEFADSNIVNTFIESWRQTAGQRIGFLYGHYEHYEAVPLGIKAVVEAIIEPPQSDETDGVALTLPWEDEPLVERAASLCGLEKVGVIYTDLLDAGQGNGSVVCKRHVDSYFLSSLEIALAATLQSQNPTPSKWSSDGLFSSRFVTCVISGNVKGEIDISSYQVSTSAEAMVKADLIEPSTNPSVMRVKAPTKTRYVPDIFYKKLNEYKLAVQENAKPAFPVEYLLVTLTHGFPESASPLFVSLPGKFPVENRQLIGNVQDLHAVSRHLGMDGKSEVSIGDISDFHLIVYLLGLGVLSEEEEKLVAKVATERNLQDGYLLQQCPGWQTLLTIIRESV